jgi:3-dehydroquinate synthase
VSAVGFSRRNRKLLPTFGYFSSPMTAVPVDESNRITIGETVFTKLSQYLKRNKFSSLFILVDENSLKHCLPVLVTNVPKLLEAEVIELESGEKNKNLEVCTNVWKALGELGADRHSLIVNLGGGVITDLGGFVASTYKRGVAFINIPTTLLAQVDASVGGKTGVDLGALKNEVGVFAEPQELFIWPTFLKTLAKRELISGLAEILKHGLIADENYWSFCIKTDLTNSDNLEEIIRTSIAIKSAIVAADPNENGDRKKLNFGHTIGHAVEGLVLERQEKTLLHGEAVALGMICESWISMQETKLPEEQHEEIVRNICRYFPLQSLNAMDDHRLIELMRHDKKNEKGDIRMVLLKTIGTCYTGKTVTPDRIIAALDYYRSLS